MFRMEMNLRGCGLAMALAFAGVAAFVPVAPALAQSAPQPRSLPDFTDLVEQVGPSVVNIRTLERSRGSALGQGQIDEDMQEFFRRFFGAEPAKALADYAKFELREPPLVLSLGPGRSSGIGAKAGNGLS